MNVHWVTLTSSITIYIHYIKSHFECVGLVVVHVSLDRLHLPPYCYVHDHPSPRQSQPLLIWIDLPISSDGISSRITDYIDIHIPGYASVYANTRVCAYTYVYTYPLFRSPVKRYVCLYNHTADLLKEMLPLFSNKIFTSFCLLIWSQSHVALLFSPLGCWQMATKSLFDFPRMIKLPLLHRKCLRPHQEHVQTFIMLLKRPWIILQTSQFWGLTCF